MSPRGKVEDPLEVPVGLILNLWKKTNKAESDEIELVYFETDVTYILPNTSDSIGLFNGVGGQGSWTEEKSAAVSSSLKLLLGARSRCLSQSLTLPAHDHKL